MHSDAHPGPAAPGAGPTFVGLPPASEPAAADLVVIGIPCDELGPGGTAKGPSALRAASSSVIPFYSPSQRVEVLPRLAAVDLGDVEVVIGEGDRGLESARLVLSGVVRAGAVALGLGGDHLAALAVLRATAERHGPMALVAFDAHPDERPPEPGAPRLSHGGMVRRAVAEGLIDPARSALLGPRGGTAGPDVHEELRELGLLVFAWDELAQLGSGAVAAAVDRAAGPAVLAIDVDLADPAFAPGVHWPVAGGPTSAQVLALARACRGLDLAAAAVTGVVPDRDPAGITGVLAATLAWEVMALVAAQKGDGR